MKTSKMRVYLVLLFINKPIICNLSKKGIPEKSNLQFK